MASCAPRSSIISSSTLSLRSQILPSRPPYHHSSELGHIQERRVSSITSLRLYLNTSAPHKLQLPLIRYCGVVPAEEIRSRNMSVGGVRDLAFQWTKALEFDLLCPFFLLLRGACRCRRRRRGRGGGCSHPELVSLRRKTYGQGGGDLTSSRTSDGPPLPPAPPPELLTLLPGGTIHAQR